MWRSGASVAERGILALRTHWALLLDYVPPEDLTGTPLGRDLEGDLPGSCVSQAQHKLRHVLHHWPLVGCGFSIV